jgi:sortase A
MAISVRQEPVSRFERTPRGVRSLVRPAEGLLWTIAAGLLGWCVFAYVGARLHRQSDERTLAELRKKDLATESPWPRAEVQGTEKRSVRGVPPAERRAVDPGLIGRIEIPRLGLTAIVREGTDWRTLERAVGHVPGTALPGQDGNVCLAAHRDTYFRPLRGVRKNDTIRITTPNATFEYTVQGISVVDPDAVEVLASTGDASLTLVTCYPFGYVGPAPRRFIVSGRLSNPPESGRAGRPAALRPSR